MPPRCSYLRVVTLAVVLLGGVSAAAHAQDQAPPVAASIPVTQDDLDRVKKALLTPPPIQIDPKSFAAVFASDARFYATAHGKEVTFLDIVGSFDLMNGPTPYAAMTHEEFMDMSRPHDPIRHVGLADLGKAAALQAASMAALLIIKKGLEAIKHAKTEHEIRAIRAQMDKELAALAGTTVK